MTWVWVGLLELWILLTRTPHNPSFFNKKLESNLAINSRKTILSGELGWVRWFSGLNTHSHLLLFIHVSPASLFADIGCEKGIRAWLLWWVHVVLECFRWWVRVIGRGSCKKLEQFVADDWTWWRDKWGSFPRNSWWRSGTWRS